MNVPPSTPHPETGRFEEVTIFVISWGRPIYLWNCLDSLYRLTRSPARIILLDNAHPDPLMGEVIAGFERRNLFSEVLRFSSNSYRNIQNAYRERLPDCGPYHVYMESDAVICDRPDCWLEEMRRILSQNPEIGMLGSLIDPQDFVPPETALHLTEGDAAQANFLAKLRSPERGFINAPEWADPDRDFFYTRPPCPIGNPAGRVTMYRSELMRDLPLETDRVTDQHLRQQGLHPAVTARVRHRHLSLLNIFDYPSYDHSHRNQFFGKPAEKNQIPNSGPTVVSESDASG